MSIFIKAGLWLEKKTGYKGEFNLTKFVENLIATTPSGLPYKVYTALLSQTGTNNPLATVLENTTGANITFPKQFAGQYQIISDVPVFTIGKTFCIVTNNNSSTSTYIAGGGMYDETEGIIQSFDNTFAQIDFQCNNGIYLEIRVYN